jgi:hypothetical protein
MNTGALEISAAFTSVLFGKIGLMIVYWQQMISISQWKKTLRQ